MTDARRKRIVNRRMAERTLHAERLQAIAVEVSGDADDGVRFQERQRIGWIVEIDRSRLDSRGDSRRHRVHVDLEADAQRELRADAGADASVLRTGYRVRHLQNEVNRFRSEKRSALRARSFAWRPLGCSRRAPYQD